MLIYNISDYQYMRLIASVITHVLQRAFNVTASDNYA